MSQENVESIYRSADAFNARDVGAFLAFNDPDVEFILLIAEIEGGGPYRGCHAVRSWMETILSVAPDLTMKVEDVRDLGHLTLARCQLRGHGVASDVLVDQTVWVVTEWRNGKAIRSQTLGSEAEALEAAGLSE